MAIRAIEAANIPENAQKVRFLSLLPEFMQAKIIFFINWTPG